MQRPSVAPAIEGRRNLNIVERRRHVRDDPENQEQAHPWHTHNHGHVLTRQAERNHAEEVEHPVHQECCMAIGNRIAVRNVRDLGLRCDGIGVSEVDLESHGDEGVGQREHEVCAQCCEPAPKDQLPELKRRVTLRVYVGHVDGQVEGEAEERDNNKI